jgi:hypothetical protein
VEYTSPLAIPCTVQVADMNRAITITSAMQWNDHVTAQTAAPHGLTTADYIYLEGSGAWNGWHPIISVPSSTTFILSGAADGGSSGGNVGVLVNDVNPALFTGANQDSRAGGVSNVSAGVARSFVVGKRSADIALDGNRYSRALQAYSRHHLTLTCGVQSLDQEFQTANIQPGDTHNEGPPVDYNNPGQYAYPTIQWNNSAQTLIDPLSGLRSKRATAPQGTPSTTQNFVTAIDSQSVWLNPSGPLTKAGGAASFTPPCFSGTCPLFLRADNLSIPGGATYTVTGSSLDWVTVSINQASISGQCSGDDCKIVACLTANGVSCGSANQEVTLYSTPATLTLGTGNLMDLWQASGPPAISRVDASLASGTVNYSSATKQLSLVSGNVFNIKWGAGSQVTIAGAPYSIASVQNERLLTLASGPASNLSGVPYSANNFGVLVWKKTGSLNRISLGYATYLYGSSTMPSWPAASINDCSSAVIVGGVQGYNCFINNEIYWLAADGSDVRDLGLVGLWYFGADEWSQGAQCGASNQPSQFDPQNGDIWYCIATPYFQYNRPSIVQAHYMGPHTQYTPGQQIPDCANNGGAQPCIQFSLMQPSGTDLAATAPPFNPGLRASNFVPGYYFMGGISSDGDMLIYTNNTGQDSLGWLFIYTLGDRTPTGTTMNSLRIIAAASTYQKAPLSYCTIHFVAVPDDGWAGIYSNDYYSYAGATGTYTMTMTSAALNANAGAPGGPSNCPANPLGVTGPVCTTVTVNGPPTRSSDGSVLQPLQVGDVMVIGGEYLRVVYIASPTQFIAQRGYTGTIGSPAGTTLTMACGTRNTNNAKFGLWDYRIDPYGANLNYATIGSDPSMVNAHNYIGGGVFVASASHDALGDSLCPLSDGGDCYQVRLGDLVTASTGLVSSVPYNPPFAGTLGLGGPLDVDSHPGPCFASLCIDGRPMVGGGAGYPGIAATLGSPASPFVNLSGQLWKLSGAQSQLHRKELNTIAYVGPWPLVDVSGPSSKIGTTSQDSFKYCYAANAGECASGSAVGDLYVNAPYVDYPYCYFPGIAVLQDDTISICIADLGAHTGNMVEFSVATTDLTGTEVRRLGPTYAKWNQFDVFWNGFVSPNLRMMGTNVRWFDRVRSDDILTVLPPFPVTDGIERTTFVPLSVPAHPSSGLNITGAVVEFGYLENGPAAAYYCTTRREACLATSSAVNAAIPFSYAHTESYTPEPCGASGCTITIPALSRHALYFRVMYFNNLGQVVDYDSPHVVLAP